MKEKQGLRQPKVFFQVVLWLAAGVVIASLLWMPLFKHVIAGE